jgi:hypothetical protein
MQILERESKVVLVLLLRLGLPIDSLDKLARQSLRQ